MTREEDTGLDLLRVAAGEEARRAEARLDAREPAEERLFPAVFQASGT